MLIDTHAHLMFPEFSKDLGDVLRRVREAGVEKIVNVGCGIESSKLAIEMAEKYEEVYASVGLHPYDALDVSEDLMQKWEKLILERKRIVAVGECGLDYVKAKIPREKQQEAFRRQLELAMEVGLPVIVHNREADEDCFRILSEFSDLKVVFHCYSSDLNFARRVWEKGWLTSFTGVITFPKAVELLEVVREMPMDKFLVETDCPYLAPQAFRGERNEPSYVVEVAKKIAEVRGIEFEEIAKTSTETALRFFERIG